MFTLNLFVLTAIYFRFAFSQSTSIGGFTMYEERAGHLVKEFLNHPILAVIIT